MTAKITNLNKLVACHECDLVSSIPTLEDGFKLVCVRCGASVLEQKKNTIDRTLAISIAGALFMIPAYSLNVVGIEAAGLGNSATLIDCLRILINSDYYLVSMLVFLFTIAFPVVRIYATIYLTYRLKFNKISPSLITFFRSFHYLDAWSLLNVFFLGLVVSMYKIFDLANLVVDSGFISFVLLLLCSTLISVTLDHHYVWHLLEQEDES